MCTVATSRGDMTIIGDRFIDNTGSVKHLCAIPSLPTEDQLAMEEAFRSQDSDPDWVAFSKDPDPHVRLAVALHGKCLNTLIEDENDDVRNCAKELILSIPIYQ